MLIIVNNYYSNVLKDKIKIALINSKVFLLFTLLLFFYFSIQNIYSQDEELICPPNSSASGDQCYCNSGYVSIDGSDGCVLESQVCAPFGPSHLVGNDCVCNAGYGVLPGGSKCENLSSACAQFNAVWSEGAGDCVCPTGLHEDSALQKCVPDVPATKKPEDPKSTEITKSTEASKPEQSSIPSLLQKATIPAITTSSVGSSSSKKLDDLMNDAYKNLDPTLQTVINENKELVNTLVDRPFSPQEDIYLNLSTENNQPISKEIIIQSVELVSPSEQEDAKQQLSVLENFSDSSESEVTISETGMGEKFEEAFVEQKYTKDLQTWKEQVSEAEKQSKLKEGVSSDDYSNAVEMETRMKEQIATLEKIVGYNHLRCLESTKVLKFENMPKEYRDHFKGQSAENMFDSASEGTAFSNASTNVIGTNAQIRELKSKLKEIYPENWKTNYLDVPVQPTREKPVQKENIFKTFEKLK